MNNEKIKILLVDNDALFLKSLEIVFWKMVIISLKHIPPANFLGPIYQNEKHSTIYSMNTE